MIKGYQYPAEMPEIFIDKDGIVNFLFGSILITAEHIIYSVDIQKKLTAGRKAPVMIVVETALNIRKDFPKLGAMEWIAEANSALAIVTTTKLARVLGDIFMDLQQNPFPTRLFDNEEQARTWLKQYL